MSTNDVTTTASSTITVSLPAELIQALDERLVNGDGNRSAVIRRLIEQELRTREERDRRKQEERELVEQYVRGWREQPQTEEEFGWSDRVVAEAWAEDPWE